VRFWEILYFTFRKGLVRSLVNNGEMKLQHCCCFC
jgi:hypothetical protein